jgi:pantoate--beta-alanine ligase
MSAKTGQRVTDTQTAVIKIAAEARALRLGLDGTVALVPTMGALHEGHLEHIRLCRVLADHVLVSVFVNPSQFGPGEDYKQYPRCLEMDIEKCASAGAAAVFAPAVDELYAPNEPGAVIDVPPLADGLEGAARPGHFQGVCLVVAKLLNLFTPDFVSFGRKDYQQLRVVEAMVDSLMMPVRVVRVPTLREPDGLAMSSRNQRLDADQRTHALGLYKALQQARMLIEQDGETDPESVEQTMCEVMRAHRVEIDYAHLRHPNTLQAMSCIEPALTGGVIALVAGRVGPVRLIDNLLLGSPEG